MSETPEWDHRFLSTDTGDFDSALYQLRRDSSYLRANLSLLTNLATQLKQQSAIPRREFDRRFRLIVSVIAADDTEAIRAIANHLRDKLPDALNAVRTLLPAGLRHLAIPPRSDYRGIRPQPTSIEPRGIAPETAPGDSTDQTTSRFNAVALIGTTEEHVRNEALLKSANLDPLRLPSLEHLWEFGPTGLCGFVVGGSAWGQVSGSDQRRAIRRLCEYSTFLFARLCVNGLAPSIAQSFSKDAAEARCGPLDAQKFCHGSDCDLTPGDITVLQSVARLLESAGTANFFPLGLSESNASLLRLIAVDRRHPENPLMIRKLGARELAGGSGARVFLLNDGSAQPFVAKIDEAERLTDEVRRYKLWVQDWEPSVTSPTFHAHLGSAAVSYRLQSAPDAEGAPAPTLEDSLESLRLAEWSQSIETSRQRAEDLFQAISRASVRLVQLNSRKNNGADANDFCLDRPIGDLATRGIEITIVDHDSQKITLSDLVKHAMSSLYPNVRRGVIHGDIHGRNILLLDRLPAFIDFAYSGPGHPLVDLVRLDAAVRFTAMRMILDKRSMHDIIQAIYVDGIIADTVLAQNPSIAASPLMTLAVRTSAKCREGALAVAKAHSLGLTDFVAMTCVVSAHVLVTRNPASGIERLILSVLAPMLATT